MDISEILSQLLLLTGFGVVLLPLLFGLYLVFSRVRLSIVPRKILDNSLLVINFISLISFSLIYFLSETLEVELGDYSFVIGTTNLKFLLYSALTYFLVTLFLKIYFIQKKQFLFTKQRFYSFLAILIFNTYIFLMSANLCQALVFWLIQGAIIFCFSYFDIFKKSASFNISRFQRLTLIGDFSLLTLYFILLKYTQTSDGYITPSMINFDEITTLFSYISGIAPKTELLLILACIILAVFSKLFIFPFNSYYSFFANSSNPLYLSVSTAANSVLGLYLFYQTKFYFELFNLQKYFIILLALALLINFIFVLFEKNLKIIFAYVISSLNIALLLASFTRFSALALNLYLALNLVLFIILAMLFIKNKTTLKKPLLINKKGYILEKIQIFIFETLWDKIQNVFEFIDRNIVSNIFPILFNFISKTLSFLNKKTAKNRPVDNLKNIIVIFLVITLCVLIVTMFGGFYVP